MFKELRSDFSHGGADPFSLALRERATAARAGLERDMAVYRRGGLFTPEGTPTAANDLRPGDVVLRVLAHEGSLGVALAMVSGYSHCGMVVARAGRLEVVDCHPNGANGYGGTRSCPLARWLGDQDKPVLHWLALRHPRIAGLAPERISAALKIDLAYRLATDNRQDVSREDGRVAGNCSTLVLEALKRLGVDCRAAAVYGELNHAAFRTFVELSREGFFRPFAPAEDKRILELSERYDMIDHIKWDGVVIPSAFAEMLPGFDLVAYGRPGDPRQRAFSIWLEPYRKLAPLLRCAVRYAGLPAGLVPRRALALGGPCFVRAVRSLPPGQDIDAERLLLDLLRAQIRRPLYYLSSLASVFVVLRAHTARRRLMGRLLLAGARPALALAQAAGWRPLRRFRRGGPA